jgi:hypothetical protein
MCQNNEAQLLLPQNTEGKRCCRMNEVVLVFGISFFSVISAVPWLCIEKVSEASDATLAFACTWTILVGSLAAYSWSVMFATNCCKNVNNFVCNWFRGGLIVDPSHHIPKTGMIECACQCCGCGECHQDFFLPRNSSST